MDDDDDMFDNQPDFIAERGVWDRVGGADIGMGLGTINLKRSGYTDMDKFKLISVATINIINDSGMLEETFSIPQITHFMTVVEKIPDYKYKNPSAFTLGYMVAIKSNYNTIDINKDMLKHIHQIYNDMEEQFFSKISEADIVRYTRLCLLNKLK